MLLTQQKVGLLANRSAIIDTKYASDEQALFIIAAIAIVPVYFVAGLERKSSSY